MEVLDGRRLLLSDQAQGSRGLNNNPIKVEAEVREQSVLDFVVSVLLLHPIFCIYIFLFHIFAIIFPIRIKSFP